MRPPYGGLSSMYVFYDRLKDDGGNSNFGNELKDYYLSAKRDVRSFVGYYKSKDNPIANKLLSMAAAELSKEQAMLNQVFGVPIKGLDLSSQQDIKELITDFNKTLNFKKNFDRNVARIKGRKGHEDEWINGEKRTGQVNIASFFGDYFDKCFDSNRVVEIINSSDMSNDIITPQAEEAIKKYMAEVAKEALILMFKSKEFKDQNGDTDDAYLELIGLLDSWESGANELIQSLYDGYQMGNIVEEIKKATQNNGRNSTNLSQNIKDINSKNIKSNRYQRGGYSLEYFENFITNALAGMHVKNEGIEINIEGKSIHTGATQMKADNIITFGIDTKYVEEAVGSLSGKQINRENITGAISKLSNQLNKLDNGFIIYSSAKNYADSLNFQGFSAGEKISAQTYINIVGDANKIGALFQTINGAISSGDDQDIRLSLAQDIAYFLFDDFETIGEDNGGAKALHLFDLDGIYVPLSVLLFKIGSAIAETQKNPTKIISIDINKPSNVRYPYKRVDQYTRKDWEDQRNEALQNVKISFHFLKDFFSMIREM